jgi:uncharacterized protein (DUF1015 family)
MADLAPFSGFRFNPGVVDVAAASAPPYDVLDDDARQALLGRCDHSVVVIDLPVPPSVTAAGHSPPEVYAEAGATLRRWIDQGVLIADSPSLYVHRMRWTAFDGQRSTIGVMGALALGEDPVLDGPSPDATTTASGGSAGPSPADILPHEHTTPKASSDRLELMRATDANLSPIWVVTPATGFSDLLTSVALGPPVVTLTSADGVHHDLWVVPEGPQCAAIGAALADHPVVVADGHHRLQTARRYRQELRDRQELRESHRESVGADRILALVTELVDGTVEIEGIHRLVTSWPTDAEPSADMATLFDLTPVTHDDPLVPCLAAANSLGLVTASGRWLARPRRGGAAADFDSQRLAAAFDSIGVTEVVFHHDEAHVTTMVRSGQAVAAILVRPPTVDQILAVAHGGQRMPPKSTFFAPKPCTGMVIRMLEGS